MGHSEPRQRAITRFLFQEKTMIDPSMMVSSISKITSAAMADVPATSSPAVASTDFGAVLSQMVGGTISDMKTAETTSIGGLTGTSSVQQVVDAIGSAQDALNITMAIRNKALAAYQQISQMTM
jgi:flagellar hook-basal body complex protein FliE